MIFLWFSYGFKIVVTEAMPRIEVARITPPGPLAPRGVPSAVVAEGWDVQAAGSTFGWISMWGPQQMPSGSLFLMDFNGF